MVDSSKDQTIGIEVGQPAGRRCTLLPLLLLLLLVLLLLLLPLPLPLLLFCRSSAAPPRATNQHEPCRSTPSPSLTSPSHACRARGSALMLWTCLGSCTWMW